jgi:aminoglycoside phosphotransferase (APT) family kinase protein
MRDVFGNAVANKYCPARWETVHGDLHWSNLLAPPDFGLLDWELWGSGPVGSDAACLYVFALLVPEIARQVHEVFADVLDTHDGQVAQLRVASRVLNRADEGEYPDLSIPVAKLADNIIR